MKTIAVLSQKGGGGRTTTSIHLGVEAERKGFAVAILDIDPQASAAGWADNRQVETPSVTSIQPTRLPKALDVARSSGADLAIIDTAPHSSDAAIAAAEQSDLVLIPCRPNILDLRAIGPTVKISKLVGKPAFVILNAVPHQAPRIIEDATNTVRKHGIKVAPVVIHQRASYAHALIVGKAAQEYDPLGNCVDEIASLFAWVRRQLAC